jgi:hypothetical protein
MKRTAAIEVLSRLKQEAEDLWERLQSDDDLTAAVSKWRSSAFRTLEREFGPDSPTTEYLFASSRASEIDLHAPGWEALAFAKSLLEEDIEAIKSKRKALVNSVEPEVE